MNRAPRHRPFGPGLRDPQDRVLDYLRIAITDRCNLRCRYCMPAQGIDLVDHSDILTFEESLRLCGLFCRLGVRKIRVTGGEPLVRRGVTDFFAHLAVLPGDPEILLTTNGILLPDHLDDLVDAGLRRVNVSLDSLDPDNWRRITRRSGFRAVLRAVDEVLARGLGLKLNVVIMAGVNDHEIAAFADFARDRPVEIRFIEAMPFDGGRARPPAYVASDVILERLAAVAPLEPIAAASGTVARTFRMPGRLGTVGVIEAHARSFCGSCNRVRLDTRGRLRTCLYGSPRADLGGMSRAGADDQELADAIRAAVAGRHADGHQAACADAGPPPLSMASIGG